VIVIGIDASLSGSSNRYGALPKYWPPGSLSATLNPEIEAPTIFSVVAPSRGRTSVSESQLAAASSRWIVTNGSGLVRVISYVIMPAPLAITENSAAGPHSQTLRYARVRATGPQFDIANPARCCTENEGNVRACDRYRRPRR